MARGEVQDGLRGYGWEITPDRKGVITGTVTVIQNGTVTVDGTVNAAAVRPVVTAAKTASTVGTTSKQGLAANTSRLALDFFNCSSVALHLLFADSGSATTSDACVPAGGHLRLPPEGFQFHGAIQIVAASGTGNAYVFLEWEAAT